MTIDSFRFSAGHPAGPSRAPFAVTPDDVQPLPVLPKALYVGTAGDVTLRGVDATADVVFRNCAAGQILDVRASHVHTAGTTVADIVALGFRMRTAARRSRAGGRPNPILAPSPAPSPIGLPAPAALLACWSAEAIAAPGATRRSPDMVGGIPVAQAMV